MAIWDIEEDVNDFFDENLAQAKENKYLKDVDAALNLISKIVPLSDGNKDFKNKIKKLDELNTSLLSAFRTVKLDNEAQLQIKLLQLSSKFKEEQKYKAIENKPIIGIGGKFSSGKSKFINSILNSGEELLPEDQMPTTSIPTYIMYGEREEISAYISENKKVALDNDALHSLTHKFYEKYKIGFSAFINCLIIYEPKLPYKDVVFLDTPGYSKADFGNKDNKQDDFSDENKAYLQLRAADYLIWLVDIENGVLSETDISFITKVGLNTPVLIVVNKSDKKLDKDIEAVTKSIEQAALDAGLNVFAVTAYSSRNNVEWQERGKISEFLNMIGNKKSCRKDAYNQILEIGSSAVQYVEEKIEISVRERNFLSELILNSEDIMEIKSLIEIYGESMEEIRSMRKSIKKYENVIKGLKDIR